LASRSSTKWLANAETGTLGWRHDLSCQRVCRFGLDDSFVVYPKLRQASFFPICFAGILRSLSANSLPTASRVDHGQDASLYRGMDVHDHVASVVTCMWLVRRIVVARLLQIGSQLATTEHVSPSRTRTGLVPFFRSQGIVNSISKMCGRNGFVMTANLAGSPNHSEGGTFVSGGRIYMVGGHTTPEGGRKQIDAGILALTPGDKWKVVGK